jgi:hypothetical protein
VNVQIADPQAWAPVDIGQAGLFEEFPASGLEEALTRLNTATWQYPEQLRDGKNWNDDGALVSDLHHENPVIVI